MAVFEANTAVLGDLRSVFLAHPGPSPYQPLAAVEKSRVKEVCDPQSASLDSGHISAAVCAAIRQVRLVIPLDVEEAPTLGVLI